MKSNFYRDYGVPVLLSVLFLLYVCYRLYVTPYAYIDFFNAYYPAGRLIIENPDNLYKIQGDSVIHGFVNLPIVAYLFTPFSLMGRDAAKASFALVGIATIFLSLFLLKSSLQIKGWRWSAVLALFFLYNPIHNSVRLGNTTHIVFLLVLGSFLSFRARRDVWSGAFLAIAGIIKLPLLFIVAYFVLKGRWQAIISFLSTILCVLGLSVAVCGFNLNLTWFKNCILAFSNKVVAAYDVQSVDGFLARTITNYPMDSWFMVSVDWRFKFLRYVILSIFIGATFFVYWSSRKLNSSLEGLEFSAFICLALLISPVCWSHYYIFLLLPFSLYITAQLDVSWKWRIPVLLSLLLVMTPNVKNIELNDRLFTFFNRSLLSSHAFWGGVLLLGVILIRIYSLKRIERRSSVSQEC